MRSTSTALITAALILGVTLQHGCGPCWLDKLTAKNPSTFQCGDDKVDIRLLFKDPELAYVGHKFLSVFTGEVTFRRQSFIFWSMVDPAVGGPARQFVTAPQPLTVRGARAAGWDPSVAVSGDLALVLWRQGRELISPPETTLLQFVAIDPTGRVLDTTAGQMLVTGRLITKTVAASDTQFLLVWSESAYADQLRRVLGLRIGRNGQILGSVFEIARLQGTAATANVAVAAARNGMFVIVWRDGSRLEMARLDHHGRLLDTTPIELHDQTQGPMYAVSRTDGRVSVVYSGPDPKSLIHTRVDPDTAASDTTMIQDIRAPVHAMASTGEHLMGVHQGSEGPMWMARVEEGASMPQPPSHPSLRGSRLVTAAGGRRFATVAEVSQGLQVLVHNEHGALVDGPQWMAQDHVLEHKVRRP